MSRSTAVREGSSQAVWSANWREGERPKPVVFLPQLQQRLDRGREDLADDERGPAEVAEWERIAQLLVAVGGAYATEAGVVAQEELAADRRREEAKPAERDEQQRVVYRADGLGRLGGAGRLNAAVASQARDEAARDLLDARGDYRVQAVDGWLARAFVDRSGHCAGPGARAATVTLLPIPVRARAALLAARPVPVKDSTA